MTPVNYDNLLPSQIVSIYKAAYLTGDSIKPCFNYDKFDMRSFNFINGELYFWYNTKDNSTHVLKVADI